MKYRGPKNPDDFRVIVRNSRHYWDALPADVLRPEGPMDPEKRTKVALPAQSTIMKAIPSDALLYWAVGKTAEAAVDDREKWERLDRDDAVDLLKKAHRKASNKAADRGNGVHEYIEAKLEGSTIDLTYIADDALAYLPVVDAFFAEQEPELVLAEVVGIGERHGVTTDAVLRLPKLEVDLAVVDWKTRNDTVKKPHVVYEKEVAQLGANLDLRYWIVEDVDTGEASRMALPDGMAAVLVTFTTTSYAVHLVDGEQAVAGFRDVLAWSEAMKRLPKAAKGIKVYDLAPAVVPSPVEEAPAEPTPEIAPDIEAQTVSEDPGSDDPELSVDRLRARMEKLLPEHEEALLAAWSLPVGLSDATVDQYPEIRRILDVVEAKVGAPFDPLPIPPAERKPIEKPTITPEPDEGPDVGDEDVETVRASFGLLEDAGFEWIADLAKRAGNLSMSQRASARRARIGWALVRLGVAGHYDDELLEAVLRHAHTVDVDPLDDVALVLSRLNADAAHRFSKVVDDIVAGTLTFAVDSSRSDGPMRLDRVA